MILRTPPNYTTTAILDADNKAGPQNLRSDGEISAATIIRSDTMARRVAARLGLDKTTVDMTQDKPSGFQELLTEIFVTLLPQNSPRLPTPIDIAARKLLLNLQARIEARSSLITINYTSPDPEEAARVANAFVSEYILDQKMRMLSEVQSAAQRSLADLTSTFGPKHPQIIRAQNNLVLAQARLQTALETAKLMTAKELSETGLVLPASAVTIPDGRGGVSKMILALLAASIASICLVFFIERRDLRELCAASLWRGSRVSNA